MPALYLAFDLTTAILEASQGFAKKISPCVLCSYDVDCEDIVDLSTEEARAKENVLFSDMACGWKLDLMSGREPASWVIARRFIANGAAGILVPSFAIGAEGTNVVLWRRGIDLPHRVVVIAPDNRLPKNQDSWA